MTVGWRQWEEIIVPVLEDERWPIFLGSTGGISTTETSGIPVVPVGSGLYAISGDLVGLIGDQILLLAIELGYGAPGEDPYGEGEC